MKVQFRRIYRQYDYILCSIMLILRRKKWIKNNSGTRPPCGVYSYKHASAKCLQWISNKLIRRNSWSMLILVLGWSGYGPKLWNKKHIYKYCLLVNQRNYHIGYVMQQSESQGRILHFTVSCISQAKSVKAFTFPA